MNRLKKPKNNFKFGDIELAVLNVQDELTPTHAIAVKLEKDDRNALALAIRENYPCLIIGEAGTGKTSAVKELAYLRQQPYVRVNMTGFTTPDELIGSKSVKDGATYFEQGIITNAMSRGAILVLDEINATTPDCLFILHGLLDEDRRITLPNGEVITPHANFRVFATCNPDYEGTKSMNKAFMDRFPIVVEVDVLEPKSEIKLLVERTGIEEPIAGNLVTIATMARNDYTEQKIMSYVSTRSLIHIARLISHGLTPRAAYETTIVKKTSNKEEKKILTDFFLSVMKLAQGQDTKNLPVVTTKKELEDLKTANKQYQVERDELANKYVDLQKEIENLKTNYQEVQRLQQDTAKLSVERDKENEQLRQKIKAYEQLEDIISKASKSYGKKKKEKQVEVLLKEEIPF